MRTMIEINLLQYHGETFLGDLAEEFDVHPNTRYEVLAIDLGKLGNRIRDLASMDEPLPDAEELDKAANKGLELRMRCRC